MAASTSGLGLAAARALLAEGARVAICGRSADKLAAAVETLGDVEAIQADVSTPAGAIGFVDEARTRLGRIDVLVVNAGGPPPGTFSSTTVDDYPAAISQNLLSVVAMCQAAVPAMQAAGWGRVVAITSVSVRQPIANLILSNTARAGATGFLKTLALEVAGDGVTVNSLLPGFHATNRLSALHDGDLTGLASEVPAGRIGDPADFGSFVAFLCSEQANFVTGTAIQVDGGAVRAIL